MYAKGRTTVYAAAVLLAVLAVMLVGVVSDGSDTSEAATPSNGDMINGDVKVGTWVFAEDGTLSLTPSVDSLHTFTNLQIVNSTEQFDSYADVRSVLVSNDKGSDNTGSYVNDLPEFIKTGLKNVDYTCKYEGIIDGSNNGTQTGTWSYDVDAATLKLTSNQNKNYGGSNLMGDLKLGSYFFTGLVKTINVENYRGTTVSDLLTSFNEVETLNADFESSPSQNAFSTLFKSTSAKNFVLPNLSSVPQNGFRNCDNVESITAGTSVPSTSYMTINPNAFTECDNLRTVTLGPTHTPTYTSSAVYFGNNPHLEKVTFGDGSRIGYDNGGSNASNYNTCFSNNPSLSEIVFGDNSTITYRLFQDKSAPATITMGNNATIRYNAFSGSTGISTVTLGDKANISNNVFEGSTVSSVRLGANATIGSAAFQRCTNLTSIDYGNIVTLGNNAFNGCSNLRSGAVQTVFSSLTSLGTDVFTNCGITAVSMPALTSIPDSAFVGSNLSGAQSFGAAQIVGDRAFMNLTAITQVDLPSVTRLGSYTSGDTGVFSGCTSLEKVVLGESLSTMGASTFNGCTKLTSVNTLGSLTAIPQKAFYNAGIASIEMPSRLMTIGNEAFSTSKLASVSVPGTVTTIGYRAFANCGSLATVTFGASSTNLAIQGSAFSNCAALAGIDFGPSSQLTDIGNNAFEGCTSLQGVPDGTNADGTAKYKAIDFPDTLATVGNYAFRGCTQLLGVDFGADSAIATIGGDAFTGCSSMSGTVTFGDSLSSIGSYAFGTHSNYAASGIQGIKFGDSEAAIEDYAFYRCTSLVSADFGNGVVTIGQYAFYGCDQLKGTPDGTDEQGAAKYKAIDFPDKLTSINYQAFYLCRSLVGIDFGFESQIASIGGYAFSGDINLRGVVTFGDSLTSLGSSCFGSGYNNSVPASSIQAVRFGNSDLTIENYSDGPFYGCKNLEGIDFGGGNKTLEYNVFNQFTSLKWVDFGTGVKSIPSSAFNGCTSLLGTPTGYGDDNLPTGIAELVIPAEINEMSSNAFYGCTKLTGLKIAADSQLTSIGSSAFSGCTDLATLALGNGITTIGSNAFNNCTKLASIDFGTDPHLEKIENSAFSGCTSLQGAPDGAGYKTLDFPDTLMTVGDSAFNNCSKLKGIDFGAVSAIESVGSSAFLGCTSLKGTVTFGDSLASLASNCFGNNSSTSASIEEVVFGNSDTEISDSAFYGCTYLKSVKFGNGNSTIGNSAFNGCTGLTSLDFGNGVTEIGDSAFEGCTRLKGTPVDGDTKSLLLPEKLTSIGNSAFKGCNSLVGLLDIPDSVTALGASAFQNTTITSLKIGTGITTIQSSTFSGCAELLSVTMDSVTGAISGSSFSGCAKLKTVSANSVSSVESSAFANCARLETVSVDKAETIGNNAFSGCTKLKEIFADSAKTIGDSAFSNCQALADLHIKSAETIGSSAFSNCDGLATLTLDSAKTIGNSAFNGCDALVTFTANAATTIGSSAFNDDDKLVNVFINGATFVGQGAFGSCGALKGVSMDSIVTLESSTNSYNSYYSPFYGCSELIGKPVVAADGTVTYTAMSTPHLKAVGNSAFSGLTKFLGLTGDSIETVGNSAFFRCSSMTTINLPVVTSIGNSAFNGCSSLNVDMNLPKVTTVGTEAFYNTKVASFTFGADLTRLGDGTDPSVTQVFRENYSMRSITVDDANQMYETHDGLLYNKNATRLYYCPPANDWVDLTLPESVININAYAMYRSVGTGELTIGSKVTDVGYQAFYGSTGITSVVIKTTAKTAFIPDNNAYNHCQQFYYCSGIEKLTIPNTVRLISTYNDNTQVFNCRVENGNAYTIDEYVFTGSGSSSLGSNYYNSGYYRYLPWHIGENMGTFKVTFGEGVTDVDAYMFNGCSNLTSVTFPSTLRTIGQNAFNNCSALESLTLPENMAENGVGTNAFSNCASSLVLLLRSLSTFRVSATTM